MVLFSRRVGATAANAAGLVDVVRGLRRMRPARPDLADLAKGEPMIFGSRGTDAGIGHHDLEAPGHRVGGRQEDGGVRFQADQGQPPNLLLAQRCIQIRVEERRWGAFHITRSSVRGVSSCRMAGGSARSKAVQAKITGRPRSRK